MADVSLELLLRQQERVLKESRLVRSDIGDFRADMEVRLDIIRRLDQSVQSLTGEVRALASSGIAKGSVGRDSRGRWRRPRVSRRDRVVSQHGQLRDRLPSSGGERTMNGTQPLPFLHPFD